MAMDEMTAPGKPVEQDLPIRKQINFNGKLVWVVTHKYRNASPVEVGQRGLPGEHYFVVWFDHDNVEYCGLWQMKQCEVKAKPQSGGCWYCGWRGHLMNWCQEFDTNVHRECAQEAIRNNPNDRETRIICREIGVPVPELKKKYYAWFPEHNGFFKPGSGYTQKLSEAYEFDESAGATIALKSWGCKGFVIVGELDVFPILVNMQLNPSTVIAADMAARAAVRMLQNKIAFTQPQQIDAALRALIENLEIVRKTYEVAALQPAV